MAGREDNAVKPDTVRDQRQHGWSWFDDKIIQRCGQELGPVGIAVYMALCTFANNNTQTCHPSQQTLAEMLGVTRPTVRKYLRKLRDLGWLEWKVRHTDEGARTSNLYVLLPPPMETKQGMGNEIYPGVVKETYPGIVNEVSTNHPKENHPHVEPKKDNDAGASTASEVGNKIPSIQGLTIAEIKRRQLSHQQWQELLRLEKTDVNPRTTLIAYIKRKLANLEPLGEVEQDYLDLWGAKKLKTPAQRRALESLIDNFGKDKVLEAGQWAARKGMSLGDSFSALETALPKWSGHQAGDSLKVGR